MNTFGRMSLITSAALLLLHAGGCGQSSKSSKPVEAPTKVAAEGHSHDGWWCDEHGVPEEVCALVRFQTRGRVSKEGRLVQRARSARFAMLHLPSRARREVCRAVRGQVRQAAAQGAVSELTQAANRVRAKPTGDIVAASATKRSDNLMGR